MGHFSIFPKYTTEITTPLSPTEAYLSLKLETQNDDPNKFVSLWEDDSDTQFIGNITSDGFTIKKKFNPRLINKSKIRPLIEGKIIPDGSGSRISINYTADTFSSIITLILSIVLLSIVYPLNYKFILQGDYVPLLAIYALIIICLVALYFVSLWDFRYTCKQITKKINQILILQTID